MTAKRGRPAKYQTAEERREARRKQRRNAAPRAVVDLTPEALAALHQVIDEALPMLGFRMTLAMAVNFLITQYRLREKFK